jgi:outer membrane protein assembly factor BamB
MKPALLSLLVSLATASAGDWPNWRGPHFDGSSDEASLPTKADPASALWKVAMPGPAASSPIVAAGKVFITTTDEQEKSLLGICFDAVTGKELWRKSIGSGFSADERSNYANPSPATDGKTVIFHFATGDTAAFDFSGKELWKRNMQKDYGTYAIQWTPASSPVITDGLAIFQVLQRNSAFEFGGQKKGNPDGPNDSYLLALDTASGKEVWKSIRPSDAAAESLESFSTPMPWSSEGRRELLVTGGDCISGHDLKSGRELWRSVSWNPEKIGHWRLVPGPIAGDGIILACAPKRAPVYAFKAGATGTVSLDDTVWISSKDHGTEDVSSDVSTPLFYKGRFYVVNSDRKSVCCVEPKSGKLLWEHRVEGGTKIESSPVAGAGHIYFQDMRANLTIMDAADQPKVVFSGPMGEGTEQKDVRSSIALADGRLYIRTASHLYCIGANP